MAPELSPFERIAERLARRLAGGVHPGQLMATVRAAVLAAVRDGVMPNDVTVLLHPDDFEEYRPALPELRRLFARELDRLEIEGGMRRIGQPSIAFTADTSVARLTPRVEAHFVHTEHRAANPRRGETRALVPLAGWHIVIDGGASVPVPFLPFTIGRAASNDLVLPGASVSSQHARITMDGAGLLIEDLGSRNGMLVAGRRVYRSGLNHGDEISIGDIMLRFERAE